MDCREVQNRMSAVFDGELSAELRLAAMQHVSRCPRCEEELAVFGKMSVMVRGLPDPEPPAEIWADIEAALDAGKEAPVTKRKSAQDGFAWRRPLILLATVASVVVLAGVGWFAAKTWYASGHHRELAAAFEEYLEHFAGNPETAQNVLLAKYGGEPVNMDDAAKQLGYRPAVAAGLPSGYSVEATYVLNMPCCTCVQSICRRDDGQLFVIFEHDEQQPAWFEDRPTVEAACGGCACTFAETDRGLVVSWNADKRALTVVGARDLAEVTDLINHLGGGHPEA